MATEPWPAIRAQVEALSEAAYALKHPTFKIAPHYNQEQVRARYDAAIAALNAKVEALMQRTGEADCFIRELLNEEPDE